MASGRGKIILLNGASSSGKSSIARALQRQIEEPFWHVSIDHLRDAGVLPMDRFHNGEFEWSAVREAFFRGFEASLAAYAGAGNNLIVEYIVETEGWAKRLFGTLSGEDMFVVGVHCPLEELERRERLRGDRPAGDARRDFHACHKHCRYDHEVDATLSPEENAASIIAAWHDRENGR